MSASETRLTVADEFRAIVASYEQAGGHGRNLLSPRFASLVISGNRVLGTHDLPGVELIAEPLPDGIAATVRVAPGT